MNDSNAALRQQLEKLNSGGELRLECGEIAMRVSSANGFFIVLVETKILPARFCDFLLQLEYQSQKNEHYLLHEDKIFYCLLTRDFDFSQVLNLAYQALDRSLPYQ